MFAPEPRPFACGYVASAQFADGHRIDLFSAGGEMPRLPAEAAANCPNFRWRSYLLNLIADEPQQKARLPLLADYLVRQWERRHPDQPVVRLEIIALLQRLIHRGRGPVQQVTLFEYSKASP